MAFVIKAEVRNQEAAKQRGVERQTPRVSVIVNRTALAKRPLGRSQLKRHTQQTDLENERAIVIEEVCEHTDRMRCRPTRLLTKSRGAHVNLSYRSEL